MSNQNPLSFSHFQSGQLYNSNTLFLCISHIHLFCEQLECVDERFKQPSCETHLKECAIAEANDVLE